MSPFLLGTPSPQFLVRLNVLDVPVFFRIHRPGAGSAEAAFVMMETQLGSNSPGEKTAASAGAIAAQQSCVPNQLSTASKF